MQKLEIYVQYGMKRSGNHAVSNALQPALTPHFFNNLVPMGPVFAGKAAVPPLRRFEQWLFSPDLARVPGATAGAWPEMVRVYTSLEDLPIALDAFCDDAPTRILVIRSFENMMSSRIRKGFGKPHPAYPTTVGATMSQILETWKQHARTYLRFEGPDRIAILFDEWVANPTYRRKIAARLCVEIDDHNLRSVRAVGGGSSFDGVRYDGRPDEMRVLERVGQLTPEERVLLDRTMEDKEIRNLSDRIGSVDPLEQI